MKYKDWLKIWLELYVKPVVKIQTYEKYERNARVHIVPALGGYETEQLNAEVLQRFVAELSQKMASNTVYGVIFVLRKSLKTAVEAGISKTCYADKLARPKAREKKVECFTAAEQKKIEKAVLESGDTRLIGIIICLYTGLRLGELLALQWSGVDLKKGMMSVDKSCHYGKDDDGKYRQITDTPKTPSSVRVIPISKQLLPYLKTLKSQSACGYVISRDGKPMNTRTYQYEFDALLKRLNIPHRGFHSLRHTFATRAIECGTDIKTLSEILGHKNASVTMNRYTHSLMDHKREVMNRIGKLLD